MKSSIQKIEESIRVLNDAINDMIELRFKSDDIRENERLSKEIDNFWSAIELLEHTRTRS